MKLQICFDQVELVQSSCDWPWSFSTKHPGYTVFDFRTTSTTEYIGYIGELISKRAFVYWEGEYFLLTGWSGSRSNPMRKIYYVGIERTLTAAIHLQTNRYSSGRVRHGKPNHTWAAFRPDGEVLDCGMMRGPRKTDCREAVSKTLFRFVSPRCVSVVDLPKDTRQSFGIDLSCSDIRM